MKSSYDRFMRFCLRVLLSTAVTLIVVLITRVGFGWDSDDVTVIAATCAVPLFFMLVVGAANQMDKEE